MAMNSILVSVLFIGLSLCLFKALGQDVDYNEVTTILNQEEIAVREVRPNLVFSKDRKSNGISRRIIGGSVATPHEYPFQVAIYVFVENSLYFCGGTLLTTEWVLTAAHCIDYATSALVVLGGHDLNQAEASRVILNSTTFIVHESWDPYILQNDVALIKLPREVTISDYISTVDIAAGSDTYVDQIGRCLGWGITVLGSTSNVLRYVDAAITTNQLCKSYSDYAPYIVDQHICASGDGYVGSCNGDSGGPLLVDGIQVGIVSFGHENCSLGYPSVYTRVTEVRSWIIDKIGSMSLETDEAYNGTTLEESTTGYPGSSAASLSQFSLSAKLGIVFIVMLVKQYLINVV